MPAPDSIRELVEKFENEKQRFTASNYNETQVRVEFINPFFAALGWDVTDSRHVTHEDRVDVEEDGKTKPKHPDYGFMIDNVVRFYVEAKAPHVNIKTSVDPAYQVRRYGWSAKLPASILTDFEEFSLYDCRIRPELSDKKSNVNRPRYYLYTDYVDKWDEIAGLLSYESVRNNKLDDFIRGEKVRGIETVDEAFLNELESWREKLAKDIALHNHALRDPSRIRDLNMAVQLTIDRIVFLRICEDREIEPYGRLRDLKNNTGIYEELKQFFRQADTRYNSGLFHFADEAKREDPDNLTLSLTIGDDALRPILSNLYYPNSPYEFSVLPADILGQVYERFLGKVIDISPTGAVNIDEKPEVRKAGGVYYTPTYIVDYIVENTVGKLLDGKTPEQVSELRILDPACGSGSFLIGAFQHLMDWHLNYYTNKALKTNLNKKLIREYTVTTPTGEAQTRYTLTTDEKKRILLNNIYGVDLDQQAVEVSKLSLLLKVLEGENTASVQTGFAVDRVLPDLNNNIKWGNSLIESDFYAGKTFNMFGDEELFRVKAFDWSSDDGFGAIMKRGGFDAVIGNPPYDVLEKDRNKSSWPHEALSEYVSRNLEYRSALGGKTNLYRFFLIRSTQLLRLSGYFGMIIPLSLLADISTALTRQYLMEVSEDLHADCFPQKDDRNRRIFFDAKLSTVIITFSKKETLDANSHKISLRIFPANSFTDVPKSNVIYLRDAELLDRKNIPIPLTSSDNWSVCRTIHNKMIIKRLGDLQEVEVRRGEINQTIYRNYIKSDNTLTRLLKGVEVGQYIIRDKLSQGEREWFDKEKFLESNNEKPVSKLPRIATQRITGVDERLRLVATIIEPETYFADSTNSINLRGSTKYKLEYFTGLLNSHLMQWRFKITSSNNNVGTNELESLPIRTIDFDNPEEVALHDRMVQLVETMLDLHKQLPATTGEAKKILERRIAATDRDIDTLVYQLYDLTPEEIAIVEGQS
ncbi:MAG: N-6 DNA methylase [Aggregatilineales bacterium]